MPFKDCPYRKCHPARIPLKSVIFKKMKLKQANQLIRMTMFHWAENHIPHGLHIFGRDSWKGACCALLLLVLAKVNDLHEESIERAT